MSSCGVHGSASCSGWHRHPRPAWHGYQCGRTPAAQRKGAASPSLCAAVVPPRRAARGPPQGQAWRGTLRSGRASRATVAAAAPPAACSCGRRSCWSRPRRAGATSAASSVSELSSTQLAGNRAAANQQRRAAAAAALHLMHCAQSSLCSLIGALQYRSSHPVPASPARAAAQAVPSRRHPASQRPVPHSTPTLLLPVPLACRLALAPCEPVPLPLYCASRGEGRGCVGIHYGLHQPCGRQSCIRLLPATCACCSSL